MKPFQQQMQEQMHQQQQAAHKRWLQSIADQQRAAAWLAVQRANPSGKKSLTGHHAPAPVYRQADYRLVDEKAGGSLLTRLLQVILFLVGVIAIGGAILALGI